jgi:hypothetical protein
MSSGTVLERRIEAVVAEVIVASATVFHQTSPRQFTEATIT